MPDHEGHETERIEIVAPSAPNNSVGLFKAISVLAGVGALLGLVHSQIGPIRERLSANENRMQRIEQRIESQIGGLDGKLQAEIAAIGHIVSEKTAAVQLASSLESERTKARLAKFDNWFEWWNKAINGQWTVLEGKVNALEDRIDMHQSGNWAIHRNDSTPNGSGNGAP